MPFGIDIQEEEMRSWGHGILETLLRDHTTGENIMPNEVRVTPSMTRLRLRKSAVMRAV